MKKTTCMHSSEQKKSRRLDSNPTVNIARVNINIFFSCNELSDLSYTAVLLSPGRKDKLVNIVLSKKSLQKQKHLVCSLVTTWPEFRSKANYKPRSFSLT